MTRATVLFAVTLIGCSPSSLLAELDHDGGLDAGSSASLRELCGNGLDDDEDSRIDDGCPCGPREMQRCFPGPIAHRGVGTCADGVQRCVLGGSEWGDWGDAPCEGAIIAEAEVCDGQDHDCDGARDEDCSCTPSETRECGASFLNAPCMAGTQSCSPSGAWTECVGAIGPTTDICNGIDNDCDGVIDLGCSCVPEPEVCDDGIDNDCDRRIDEPACRPDWPVCRDATPGWVPISTFGAPRTAQVVAVWTGTEMLTWNGALGETHGHRFDPVENQWGFFLSVLDEPSPRVRPAATWTGREMLIWGGARLPDFASLGDGSAYDLSTGTWRRISMTGAPVPRHSFVSVWTGAELIVWGGQGATELLRDGGAYEPASDSWRPLSMIGAPTARAGAHAVWTGTEMVVWGAASSADRESGAIYHPGTDSWRPLELVGGPGPRESALVAWTGEEMAVWGGVTPESSYSSSGFLFDPDVNQWRGVPTVDAPRGRQSGEIGFEVGYSQVAASTGHGFLIWGGLFHTDHPRASGAMYDSWTNRWRSIPELGEPVNRIGHVAIWTGCSLIVWGGRLFDDTGAGHSDTTGGIWIPE